MLQPGTLWPRILQQTRHALECGALQSIPTDYEFIHQAEIRFLVRTLSNLVRKDEASQQQAQQKTMEGKDFNPFLPYEEDLFVTDISETHLCLLNKFNVVDHHLLIVTRAFADQDTWLTVEDFVALWACLTEVDGLAFYNGGKIAGASQRHKHLQLVPLPFTPEGVGLPITPVLHDLQWQEDGIGTIPAFPFIHGILPLPSHQPDPFQAAETLLACYRRLLEAVGLPQGEGNYQSGAYNLLATRAWILIVPRSQESYEAIAVNSLGFAGSLFVRTPEQLTLLKQLTPLTLLQQVAFAKPEPNYANHSRD